MIDIESEFETNERDEILAEIALFHAFQREPKNEPFVTITIILLVYDYLYYLPVVYYGLFIVAIATLGGLVTGLRGRSILAAEQAGLSDSHGIPANLRFNATNVANSTITIVYVGIGITIQMIATSGALGRELLSQNRLAGGSIPPIVAIVLVLVLLPVYGRIRGRL